MKTIKTINSNEEEIDKARFFFDVAVKSDEVIQKANERITDKIRGFMSIAATLIPIILGIGYFILKQTTSYLAFVFSSAFFLLSLGCLIAAIIVGIYLQRPLAYRVFNPYVMMKKHNKQSQLYVINKYAITWSHIVDRNLKKINYKQYYLNAMLALICSALALLVATFLVLVFALPRPL